MPSSIPEGMGPQLEGRFAGRAKMVEQFEGFEDFQLLRPVEGEDRYFVYTRWATEETSRSGSTARSSVRATPTPAVRPAADTPAAAAAVRTARPRSRSPRVPILLSFEVVEHVVKGA